jgi:hypothetical protein
MGLKHQNRGPVTLTADYSREFLCNRNWCGDQGVGGRRDGKSELDSERQ